MGGKKDLSVDPQYKNGPLVLPLSNFEDHMYLEMAKVKRQLKAIREILKDC